MGSIIVIFLICMLITYTFSYDQFVRRGTTIATSSTTFGNYVAARAVDENFDQDIRYCSHTDNSCYIKEAWLRINLRRVYSIRYVKFWYRTDRNDGMNTARLPGYSILVSDESWPNSSCYRDPNINNLTSIIENECRATTQYIWFYQPYKSTLRYDCAPMLEICEVQVYGCDVGYYGENCSMTCGLCKSGTCNIVTGQCDDLGCIHQGFQAPACNECVTGFYGSNCSTPCSKYCKNNTCDQTAGTCLEGCVNGYTGYLCNKICPNWKYGENCSETCGNCFQNQTCNHVNGTCLNGCQKGFRGQFCLNTCTNGTYGRDCMQNCSGNCLDNIPCSKTNGKCTQCSPGWINDFCSETCTNGTFGENCMQNCSGNCLDNLPCSKTNGKCTHCSPGWINDFCSERIVSSEQLDTNEGPNLMVIVGSVTGVAVILLSGIILIVILRRRQKRLSRGKHEVRMQDISELDDDQDIVLKETEPETVYYNQVQICRKDINISEILATIQWLEKDSDKEFHKEFKSIPYGEQPDKPCKAGRRPDNIPKNRFKTTFPYDHSRVTLRYPGKTQDYINANFIKNTYKVPVYIASQGPKSSTIEDFWQMVWQEHVYVIAMVTNLTEGGTRKCSKYWPDYKESQTNEDICILLESEKTYASFVIHQLQLTSKKTKETRQITHLEYTGWPDHGTPNPLELLMYYQYVTTAVREHLEHKLLVHCSAGIGRTGTFIALDALYRHGINEGKINIVEYVHIMREDRMNMIQNLEQYKFLYRALYESFRAKSHLLSKEKFAQNVESILASDKAINLSDLRIQFKELVSLKPVFEDSEMTCGNENIALNMTSSVLPADKIRIILSSHVQGRGTYYNAVPVSTFTMRDCIIVGQYPVAGAAVDLIRLLVDQECSTLISTNPLSEVTSSKEWFCVSPGESVLSQYQVKVDKSIRVTDHIMKTNIRIKSPVASDWHDVTLYEMTSWSIKDKLPRDCRPLLDVIAFLQQNEKVDAENKIAILSRDGAIGCGVFCAVYNAIQQLQQDQEVDMFTIVRQLQSRRPEMIADWEEYMFSCQTVLQFIQQNPEEVYMNYLQTEENVYANT